METVEDFNQVQARVELVGTQFGVEAPNVPLPPNITRANDGYLCPNPTTLGIKFTTINFLVIPFSCSSLLPARFCSPTFLSKSLKN